MITSSERYDTISDSIGYVPPINNLAKICLTLKECFLKILRYTRQSTNALLVFKSKVRMDSNPWTYYCRRLANRYLNHSVIYLTFKIRV